VITQSTARDLPSVNIGADELHLWRVRLTPTPDMSRAVSMLSIDERERADRFRREIDRDRFVTARAALRTVLARYVDVAPERLRFSYRCVCGTGRCLPVNRKPSLAADCGGTVIRFNLAHSADLAAIAVCRDREVGIDVERIDVAASADLLSAAPAGLQPGEFFEYWTRREAVSKAFGLGLTYEHQQPAASGWWVRNFEPAAGFAGAVAAHRPFATVAARSVDPLGNYGASLT
jgi:4'-phosphopantetheinyl transferase